MKIKVLIRAILFILVTFIVSSCFPEIEPDNETPVLPIRQTFIVTGAPIVEEVASVTSVPPTAPAAATPSLTPAQLEAAAEPAPTMPPASLTSSPTQELAVEDVIFSFEADLAAGVQGEVMPPAPFDAIDGAIIPQHVQFTFEEYALPETFHVPRIYVYPAGDFAAGNEIAANRVGRLKELLVDRPVEPSEPLPFLPLLNAGQMMLSRLKYLNFSNGSGIRYLTQLGQSYQPINNRELFYTFQGLTDDGAYYVATILPVAHPSLPADPPEMTGEDAEAFASRYEAYVSEVEEQLNREGAATFAPDLARLDAFVRSLRVKDGQSDARLPSPYDYSGWQKYTNEKFGYTALIPGDVNVTESGDGTTVSFEEGTATVEHWPGLTINHYDSDFYHPPEDSEVGQWVLGSGIPHDEVGLAREIAGRPALHLIIKSTPEAYAFDEYYFIKDSQLFRVVILPGGDQDWQLIDQFLQSFYFEETPPVFDDNGVSGWPGTIGRFPTGSRNEYYFDRIDGRQFIIAWDDERLGRQIEEAAWNGQEVEIWGNFTEAPDFINISRLEPLSGPSDEVRDLSPFALASASSELPADRLANYGAWLVVDGAAGSPWCEGAPRTGIGEWIMLEFPESISVDHLVIVNGFDRNDETFWNHNRVEKANIIFLNGSFEWQPEDIGGTQLVGLPDRLGSDDQTTFVKLEVVDVYPGLKYDVTCIDEIQIWGKPR